MRDLEKNLGYDFKDKELLKQAITHKSQSGAKHNERLEFLGDAVLDLVVAELLFEKFKDVAEGKLSKLRAALVNEKSFAKIANSIKLGTFILMSASEQSNNGRKKPSILSDAFEAIIGAIFLEAGFKKAKEISLTLIQKNFPDISLDLCKDYKTELQEYTQATMAQTPEYITLRAFGPDHKKKFEIALELNGKEMARAISGTKKEAQQIAARLTLEKLGLL
ncbi:ribonuclease III [Campylobacter avium]|uniref:ribonuclease III n=1 Tax=Campylobacter avium TaxID=522485 RepID=UPI00255C1FDF|nr:ribonuclease III [Campylobacter avium]